MKAATPKKDSPAPALESVGWGFFGLALLGTAPPAIYAAWRMSVPLAGPLERVALGLILAAVLAAVLAWGVNEALHRRNLRRQSGKTSTETRKSRNKL